MIDMNIILALFVWDTVKTIINTLLDGGDVVTLNQILITKNQQIIINNQTKLMELYNK